MENGFAPAKINLSLRIIGQREDGYHLLSSLVLFAEQQGDEVQLTPADDGQDRLFISGPFTDDLKHFHADVLTDNILGKTLASFRRICPKAAKQYFHIHLMKNLPLGGGIGGGSSDATALLRLLSQYYASDIQMEDLYKIAVNIGADVAVCLQPNAQHMQGIGENITPLQLQSPIPALLINPYTHLATVDIFKHYHTRSIAFSKAHHLINEGDENDDDKESNKKQISLENIAPYLHNDLLASACHFAPEIALLLQKLQDEKECVYANMSGSGATCFALCKSEKDAFALAQKMRYSFPKAWIKTSLLV